MNSKKANESSILKEITNIYSTNWWISLKENQAAPIKKTSDQSVLKSIQSHSTTLAKREKLKESTEKTKEFYNVL
jgi:hypothetical protein